MSSYTRLALCTLAGTSVQAFKTAARRDQLPLLSAFNDQDSEGWSRFNAMDVLKLACTEALSRPGGYVSVGLTFAEAAKIIDNADLDLSVGRISGGSARHFVGYAARVPGLGGRNVWGSLAEIDRQLDGEDDPYVTLHLVDVAAVVTTIRERAEEFGLPFDLSEAL